MTELSDRIQEEIDKGISVRGIARKAGMSDNTVRRARDGYELDRSTLEKFAEYFRLPIEDVYRMAGNFPSSGTSSSSPRRIRMQSEMLDIIHTLTDSEVAELYTHLLRIEERRENKTEVQQT